ncbi:MAG: alpha/beta fold hydrolase [Acidobacteriaceae bacterium]
MMFLNGLSATRSGHGDTVARWAEEFAGRGYPSFRIDLPGYGDSEDDPPTEWLDFVNQGGYASSASSAINEIVTRYNLSGVVIVGHCAGAVSATYTAAVSRQCRGLILMDPYFHLPETNPAKIRGQLHVWAMQSRLGGLLSGILAIFKGIRLLFRGSVPPKNANFPLLRCWKKLASTSLPILILRAPGRKSSSLKPKVGEFDYLEHILGLVGPRNEVVVSLMDGANHSFANRVGRAAVRQHVEQWLNMYFSLTPCDDSEACVLPSETSNSEKDFADRERCLKA